jgi:hypothetical protein
MDMSDNNEFIIDGFGNKKWFKNDLRHRLDGPAIEWIDGGKSYCLYGYNYSPDIHKQTVANLPLLYWTRFKMGEWI